MISGGAADIHMRCLRYKVDKQADAFHFKKNKLAISIRYPQRVQRIFKDGGGLS